MYCLKIRGLLRVLSSKIDERAEGYADVALKLTTRLKQLLEAPVTDVLIAIIPGDADERLREQLIAALGKVVKALLIAEECRDHEPGDQLNCFVNQLRELTPELRDAILQKMASLITAEIDGNHMRQCFYDLCTQAKYALAKV